ncbi:MAG TPA: helix-turn-helix transcriptional regulator [Gemmatimonadales bacterium]
MIVKIRKSEYLVVARLLKEARERSGLTQRDVAARLKVPQSFVSKYESAERRLDVLELRRLCRVLKISLPDLIRNIESSLGGSE